MCCQVVYPRGLEVPEGWEECPRFGTAIETTNIVPIKVSGQAYASVASFV